MNEEIDGGLGKDNKRKNVKKTTFENQAGLCCRLEQIMTDNQTLEDQAVILTTSNETQFNDETGNYFYHHDEHGLFYPKYFEMEQFYLS